MSSDRRFRRAVGRVLIALSFKAPTRSDHAASLKNSSRHASTAALTSCDSDMDNCSAIIADGFPFISSCGVGGNAGGSMIVGGQSSSLGQSSFGDDSPISLTAFAEPVKWRDNVRRRTIDDASDTERTPPPKPRRERRKAIYDSQCLGLVDSRDDDVDWPDDDDVRIPAVPNGRLESASTSRTTTAADPTSTSAEKQRSYEDLGVNYPGDLLSDAPRSRPRRAVPPPLIKRNTVADFANTKAYQASTASLISASEQEKKLKSAFSLLKLIDKKAHSRSRDNLVPLCELLTSLKPSEFTDAHLARYKDGHWTEVVTATPPEAEMTSAPVSGSERKRREAIWELFTSQCVFLFDHLMVLKHCFMEPLKKVQVEGHLMFAEPQDLFGNLDELCYVTYTFCYDFITLLVKDAQTAEFGRTEVLVEGLTRFCQLTRNGEVYHDYCLNYAKAISYLEQLRKNEDFCEFEKWCDQDTRCRRLLLTDLLIAPMQHCTKVPLLLNSICQHTVDPLDKLKLTQCLQTLETSLKLLEKKMISLKNFERLQELQQQIVWQSVLELEPRTLVPEFLRSALNRQPCSSLLGDPERLLLHEGPLTLTEVSKTIDMYAFLFDDILLLTKIKKPPRKKSSSAVTELIGAGGSCGTAPGGQSAVTPTDGAVFVVHRQPIALDRITVTDVRPREAAANSLKNAFVVVQVSRFQQILAVYTLQAPSEAVKITWLAQLQSAQQRYRENCIRRRRLDSCGSGSAVLLGGDAADNSSSSTSAVPFSRLTTYLDVTWQPTSSTVTASAASSTSSPPLLSLQPAAAAGSNSRQASPASSVAGSRERLQSTGSSPPTSVVVSVSDSSDWTDAVRGGGDGRKETGMGGVVDRRGGGGGLVANGRAGGIGISAVGGGGDVIAAEPSCLCRRMTTSSCSPLSYLRAPQIWNGEVSSSANGNNNNNGPVFGFGPNNHACGSGNTTSGCNSTSTNDPEDANCMMRSRPASLYSRRRTILKAIREKSLSIDIDLMSATQAAANGTAQ